MKKNTRKRVDKLALNREIVRRLSDRELQSVAGGWVPTDANACGPPLPSWELCC